MLNAGLVCRRYEAKEGLMHSPSYKSVEVQNPSPALLMYFQNRQLASSHTVGLTKFIIYSGRI